MYHIYKKMEKYIKIGVLNCHVTRIGSFIHPCKSTHICKSINTSLPQNYDLIVNLDKFHLRLHNLNCFNKITQRLFYSFIINGLQTTIAKIFFKDFAIWHIIRHNVVS